MNAARRAIDAAFRVHGVNAQWVPAGALAPVGTVRLLVPRLEDPVMQPANFASRLVTSPFRFQVRVYEGAFDEAQGGAPLAQDGELTIDPDAGGDWAQLAGKTFKIDGEPKPADRLKLTVHLGCYDAARFQIPEGG